MTYALIAALIAQTALIAWLLNRFDARSHLERDAERDERQALLQRIQAPEAAVYEHATRGAPEDQGAYPMSDEQLAEQQERDRVLAFIERHEA